ncbi:hypothetical protein HB884_05155 [Listeria booriae]|uniref:hypothetical protein n=1 Tax=Listeria booriae TaxID=1552123 RepID=UPI0016249075|nr:hypothetical protein [Listeria booriae]MBC1523592.1 hypothetical protein [Listeria booriae]
MRKIKIFQVRLQIDSKTKIEKKARKQIMLEVSGLSFGDACYLAKLKAEKLGYKNIVVESMVLKNYVYRQGRL